jgi:hypothetical protein
MVHIAFDTLKFVERLRSAGVSEAQAKAMSETQVEVFAEALDNSLATKIDVIRLENKIDKVEDEVKHVKWILGFMVACLISIMVKTFI